MAYPTVSAPYGFKAVSSADGKPYAGATRQLKLATTTVMGSMTVAASPIFYGDLVYMQSYPDANGARIARWYQDQYSESPTPYGVFVGCTFINPVTKQPTWSQYWPGPSVAPDAVGYIIDDPMALFQVAITDTTDSTTAAVTEAQYWAIGMDAQVNPAFLGSDGNTNTGDSFMSILPPENTGTYGVRVRIIDVVPASETTTGYPEVQVILKNTGLNSPAPVPTRGAPF